MPSSSSAACIILMAGTGVRTAFENSVLLIHRMVWDDPPEPAEGEEELPPPDEKYVELCRRLENAYLGRFLNHDALWAEKSIPTALDMSTDDALRLGVIDGVTFRPGDRATRMGRQGMNGSMCRSAVCREERGGSPPAGEPTPAGAALQPKHRVDFPAPPRVAT